MRHPHPFLPERITAQWLQDIRACKSQVGRFADEWPDGVEPSIEALERAHEIGLDLGWLTEAVVSEVAVADVRRFVRRCNAATIACDEAARAFREAWRESALRIYDAWRAESCHTEQERQEAHARYGAECDAARGLFDQQTAPFFEAKERDLLAIYLDVLFPEVEVVTHEIAS